MLNIIKKFYFSKGYENGKNRMESRDFAGAGAAGFNFLRNS